jgi:LysR family cys regulon transcriptional activator
MTLQQLRYLCGIADKDFNISHAAKALHTSQPGISKQVQMLESELGVDILIRSGNRVVGLTQAGETILHIARRMLWDAENLRRVGEEFTKKGSGRLVLGTTHIYARYLMRPVIRDFMREHPDVSLVLRQGNPAQIAQWVEHGEADLGIFGAPSEGHPELVFLQGAELQRCIITLPDHPLLRKRSLTLEALAEYPIITLDSSFPGGLAVIRTFEEAGIRPNIVLSATDADVIKSYVELDLGIAILPSIAYEPERDINLRSRDVSRIFAPIATHVALRQGKYLPCYMKNFIGMLFPQWDEKSIERIMRGDNYET